MAVPWTDDLVRLLLAPACAVCGTRLTRPLSSPACEACWSAIPRLAPPWCGCCGDTLPAGDGPLCGRCRIAPRHFGRARSAGRYDGSLRGLIHAFKYDRRRTLAPRLAALIRASAADVLEEADGVVPVPLHPWRAWRRGFNQADDLACGLGLPVWRVLRRRHLGSPQSRLPAEARRDNVRQAFVHSRRAGRRSRLSGRVLVVVDDVMTTGETVDACSRVLLESGAREVRVATLARAAAGRPLPLRPRHPPSTVRRR